MHVRVSPCLLLAASLCLAGVPLQAQSTSALNAPVPVPVPVPVPEDSTTLIEGLIRSGNYAAAESALHASLAKEVNSWRAQYQLGYVLFQLHRFHESVAALCKSLLLNRSFADAHRILAYDLNVLGRQDWAITELQTSLRLEPASADAHYELGRIFYERGAYAGALEHLEQARTLTPSDVRVYHNLGLAYAALGRKNEAVTLFEEGLQRNSLQPHPSAWPLIDYASFRNNESQFEDARRLAAQAVTLDSQSAEAFNELAKAYRGLDRTTEAITALARAVALHPGRADYHYVLARLYTKTHQKAAADAELSAYAQAQALASPPKNEPR